MQQTLKLRMGGERSEPQRMELLCTC
jgi:hypothetical protein